MHSFSLLPVLQPLSQLCVLLFMVNCSPFSQPWFNICILSYSISHPDSCYQHSWISSSSIHSVMCTMLHGELVIVILSTTKLLNTTWKSRTNDSDQNWSSFGLLVTSFMLEASWWYEKRMNWSLVQCCCRVWSYSHYYHWYSLWISFCWIHSLSGDQVG